MPDYTELHKQISALVYHHKEGGRYAYVKLLSLTRDLPPVLTDPGDRLLVEKLRERLNDSLCERFSLAQERFFEGARAKILGLLPAISLKSAAKEMAGISKT